MGSPDAGRLDPESGLFAVLEDAPGVDESGFLVSGGCPWSEDALASARARLFLALKSSQSDACLSQ